VGDSRLSRDMPLSMRFTQKTRETLRPLVRIFSKTAVNTTSVPAKAIVRIAFQKDSRRFGDSEPYYILDDAYEASSVIGVLRDRETMNNLLTKVIKQAGLTTGQLPPTPA
jgi:mannan polymerase II complex ANP1 subunit